MLSSFVLLLSSGEILLLKEKKVEKKNVKVAFCDMRSKSSKIGSLKLPKTGKFFFFEGKTYETNRR